MSSKGRGHRSKARLRADLVTRRLGDECEVRRGRLDDESSLWRARDGDLVVTRLIW